MTEVDQGYVGILKTELAKRFRRNSAYSLRAFARDLDISPSTISEILSGKHGLSRQKASDIADRLKFAEEVKLYFCDLVDSVHNRSREQREAALANALRYQNSPKALHLSKDVFEFIADWYHLAILSLMTCGTFEHDPQWIARALRITPNEALGALHRLERLGFIVRREGGYELVQKRTATPAGTSREAMLAFHYDVVSKALASVYEQTAAERELSSTIIAIPKSRLDEARTMIREFRQRFADELYSADDKDEVYCLAMQFFPVSHTAAALQAGEADETSSH